MAPRRSVQLMDDPSSVDCKFFANDCIANYLEEGDIEDMEDEVRGHLQKALQALAINIQDDHNTKDTAKRMAKMWIHEIFAGRYTHPPEITSFPNDKALHDLYTTGPIAIKSTCAHHFQNITGKCWVGIVPNEKLIGLSKFNRIVHHIASRPQIQEEMTKQIADALLDAAETNSVAVVIKAKHHCVTHRGVNEHESDMITSSVDGLFRENSDLRAEFMQLITSTKGFRE
jgi:GTP cyclohydrolase I